MEVKECEERERGFTLIELLITVVVVGLITAVAIVGAGSLVRDGSGGACMASADASKAASLMHFANTGTYPDAFADMTASTPKTLDVPAGVIVGATTLTMGASWTVTMTGGGTSAVDYECS